MEKKHKLIFTCVFGIAFGVGFFLASPKTGNAPVPSASVDKQEKDKTVPQSDKEVSKPTKEEQAKAEAERIKKEQEEKEKERIQKEQQAKRDQVQTIGFTTEEFKVRFNQYSIEKNVPFIISQLQAKEELSRNTFEYSFDEYRKIKGTINPRTNQIRNFSAIVKYSNDLEGEVKNFLFLLLCLRALDKDSTPEDLELILSKLLEETNANTDSHKATYVHNSSHYMIEIIRGKATRLSVKNVQDTTK